MRKKFTHLTRLTTLMLAIMVSAIPAFADDAARQNVETRSNIVDPTKKAFNPWNTAEDLPQVFPTGNISKDNWLPGNVETFTHSQKDVFESSKDDLGEYDESEENCEIKYEYSTTGQVLKETTPYSTRTFEYNERGQIVKILSTEDGITSMTTYSYDCDILDWCETKMYYANASDNEPSMVWYNPLFNYSDGLIYAMFIMRESLTEGLRYSYYLEWKEFVENISGIEDLYTLYDAADAGVLMNYEEYGSDYRVSAIYGKSNVFEYEYVLTDIVWERYTGNFQPKTFAGLTGEDFCTGSHRIKSANGNFNMSGLKLVINGSYSYWKSKNIVAVKAEYTDVEDEYHLTAALSKITWGDDQSLLGMNIIDESRSNSTNDQGDVVKEYSRNVTLTIEGTKKFLGIGV